MQRWRLYASSEGHHSVFRAAGILGIGRRNVSQIPIDAEMRIDLAALEAALDRDAAAKLVPIALVANAGTTNTGAIDPIDQMVAIACRRKIWLHVDGAYGLLGKLDPRVATLFDGVEQADSVIVDPHKWLAAPTGSAAVFVRDPALQERAFTMEPADYAEGAMVEGEANSTFDSLGDDYLQIGPEMSAPSRGVAVWAILKEIGADGVRDRISRHCSLARHVSSWRQQTNGSNLSRVRRSRSAAIATAHRTQTKARLMISMQRSRDDCAWGASYPPQPE